MNTIPTDVLNKQTTKDVEEIVVLEVLRSQRPGGVDEVQPLRGITVDCMVRGLKDKAQSNQKAAKSKGFENPEVVGLVKSVKLQEFSEGDKPRGRLGRLTAD